MSFANDNFTGVDGTTLQSHTSDSGHSWTLDTLATKNAVISSNKITGAVGAGTFTYGCNVTPSSADYSVQADVTYVNAVGAAATRLAVVARLDPTIITCYVLRYTTSGNSYNLLKLVAGVSTTLATYSVGISNGQVDTIKLVVQGSTISGYVNGTLQMTVTDSSITAAGVPGVRGTGVAADDLMDNWSASNIPSTNRMFQMHGGPAIAKTN